MRSPTGFDTRQFQNLQALGIMNALKTGDPTTDTMIALLLPLGITKVLDVVSTGLRGVGRIQRNDPRPNRGIGSWLLPPWLRDMIITKRYTRTIQYRTTQNSSTGATINSDEDTYNRFLIRAIKL